MSLVELRHLLELGVGYISFDPFFLPHLPALTIEFAFEPPCHPLSVANREGRWRKQPVNLVEKPKDFACNMRLWYNTSKGLS
jgi:hypothetical protein